MWRPEWTEVRIRSPIDSQEAKAALVIGILISERRKLSWSVFRSAFRPTFLVFALYCGLFYIVCRGSYKPISHMSPKCFQRLSKNSHAIVTNI